MQPAFPGAVLGLGSPTHTLVQGSTSTHRRTQAAFAALGMELTLIPSCNDTLTHTHAPPSLLSPERNHRIIE